MGITNFYIYVAEDGIMKGLGNAVQIFSCAFAKPCRHTKRKNGAAEADKTPQPKWNVCGS